MQENERTVVVGDPAALGAVATRRSFLRALGMGGSIVLLPSVFAACRESTSSLVDPEVTAQLDSQQAVVLNLSNDVGILNYAFALEQLEAAFYTQVVANAAFTSIFPREEQIVLRDLRDHEIVHREFFRAALGTNAIPDLTVNFGTVAFNNRGAVLSLAQTFEDLGVGAYNGAGRYLTNEAFLAVAGKIVSVEARHASAIRAIRAGNYTDQFAPNAFDPATPPAEVLAAAGRFITQRITLRNA